MSLKHEFNRIGHLFNDGVGKTQKTAGDWAGKRSRQAVAIARQAQDQPGMRSLVTVEENIVRHVRENPALYLMAGALVLGAVLMKLIMESRHSLDLRDDAPLL